jgi:hypothetical protein
VRILPDYRAGEQPLDCAHFAEEIEHVH